MSNLSEYNNEIISCVAFKKYNNDSAVSLLRDTFLESESQYVYELLQDEQIRDMILTYNDYDPSRLAKIAKDLISKVEMNLVLEEQMENTEKVLTIILSAIRDVNPVKYKVKKF